MKPLVIEKDGVRVAVAVQVKVQQCTHGAATAGSPQLPPQTSHAGPSWLENGCEAVGVAADHCFALARFLVIASVLGVGRALMLAVNVAGLLGAKVARGYLLGWASVGGTHKQLSRSISPWLPEARTPSEHHALVCEAFERPKHIEGPQQYAPRMSVDQVLWQQRKQLGYQLYPGAKLPPELPAETKPKRKERT